jgi:hypothetical protein
MAIVKHKVLELSYIGGALRNPGDIVDHEDGEAAGGNLRKATAREIAAWQRGRGESLVTPNDAAL